MQPLAQALQPQGARGRLGRITVQVTALLVHIHQQQAFAQGTPRTLFKLLKQACLGAAAHLQRPLPRLQRTTQAQQGALVGSELIHYLPRRAQIGQAHLMRLCAFVQLLNQRQEQGHILARAARLSPGGCARC